MPLNVIIPSEPKNPSSIFKYERKDTPSADLEGLLVLCFLGILIGVYFKRGNKHCVNTSDDYDGYYDINNVMVTTERL
ncbi:conserved Plasmodium protein, unknown function [Plasmodium chabaudi chabaudi]|uniref:Uncharacterized protein n=1 Tax=Plasmodium chabaudi chabaudi TaxID=31271 RepID=A0A1C6YSW2_PLACU|nr:conserved Plasmodium protein, unknown function [Plasmodium chabaudi chabaudi]